jgi:hypothetical protein
MPPALDRLLASPSALRLLRSLVHGPERSATITRCCRCEAPRRAYHTGEQSNPGAKWPRWRDKARPKTFNLDGATSDGIEGQKDTARWAQELQRQERLFGLAGIRNAWDNNHTLRLPTEDTLDAECLWGTFLRHPDLVFPVLSHAAYLYRKTGAVYPHLYELCMGHWLAQEKHVDAALDYHEQMVRNFELEELPLRHLARLGRQRFSPKAYDVFLKIYETSNERNIYDEVIPALLARGSTTTVQQWHTLCVRRGDLPSAKVASHPLVRALSAESTRLSDAEAKIICTVAGVGPGQASKMNEKLLRRLLGRDMAPVRFDDTTCARMFATRAFTAEAVIKGIAMVGVNEIGPLAVRAMAARCDPISDLPQRFEQLRSLGIALQGCVFSLALDKFSSEKQWLVVRSILESDQHPEVYDDRKLQKELLDYYLKEQDWVQAHRTLAVLSLFYNDASTESWNILLQAHVRSFSPRRIEQTLQLMRDKHVMLAPESISAIKGCLRRRQRGHKPGRSSQGRFDDVRFVERIFTGILESGMAQLPPTMWREILRRLGMLGRFRELRRLLFWLMSWYAPRNGSHFASLPKPSSLDAATERLRAAYPDAHSKAYFRFPPHRSQAECVDHPIRQLAPQSLQQALIVWGFRAGFLPNAPLEQSMLPPTLAKRHYRPKLLDAKLLGRLDWSVGLRLLVQLRDMGLHVHHHTVTKTVQMMMINMFGRGRSLKKENRIMAAANTIPYAEYVREVNEIWGSPLLQEPSSHGTSVVHGQVWHPRVQRQVSRKTFLGIGESLPLWQAPANRYDGAVNVQTAESPSSLERLGVSTSTTASAGLYPQRQDGPEAEADGKRKKVLAKGKAATVGAQPVSAMEELDANASFGRRRPLRRRTAVVSPAEGVSSDMEIADQGSSAKRAALQGGRN